MIEVLFTDYSGFKNESKSLSNSSEYRFRILQANKQKNEDSKEENQIREKNTELLKNANLFFNDTSTFYHFITGIEVSNIASMSKPLLYDVFRNTFFQHVRNHCVA